MDDHLTFYTHPMSRGRTVRWMLEEVGVPYRAEIVQYGPEMKSPAFLAINPMGKVPALVHRGVVVTEQAAICTYLADAFPAAGLAPPTDDPARGSYLRWLFFCAAPMEQAMMNRSFGFEVPHGPQGSGRVGYGSYSDALNAAEQAVANANYLAGGKFSAADLYMTALLDFGMMTGAIDKRPAFEAFVALHRARPAAIRAADIDNALLPKPA